MHRGWWRIGSSWSASCVPPSWHRDNREEAIIAIQQEFGRHLGPRIEWPRLGEWRLGLPPIPVLERRCHHTRCNVMDEHIHDVEAGVGRSATTLVQLSFSL
jgi:hypothetical protein